MNNVTDDLFDKTGELIVWTKWENEKGFGRLSLLTVVQKSAINRTQSNFFESNKSCFRIRGFTNLIILKFFTEFGGNSDNRQ